MSEKTVYSGVIGSEQASHSQGANTMKTVSKVMTFDGKLHDTQKDAVRHVEAIYADKLSKLAVKLVSIEKYVALGNFIDENLALFLELASIKADMEVEKDSEED
jgi:hypothetical protein